MPRKGRIDAPGSILSNIVHCIHHGDISIKEIYPYSSAWSLMDKKEEGVGFFFFSYGATIRLYVPGNNHSGSLKCGYLFGNGKTFSFKIEREMLRSFKFRFHRFVRGRLPPIFASVSLNIVSLKAFCLWNSSYCWSVYLSLGVRRNHLSIWADNIIGYNNYRNSWFFGGLINDMKNKKK